MRAGIRPQPHPIQTILPSKCLRVGRFEGPARTAGSGGLGGGRVRERLLFLSVVVISIFNLGGAGDGSLSAGAAAYEVVPTRVSISTEENIYRSPAPNPDAILDYVPEMNTIAATNTDSVQEANDPTRDPVSCLVCRNGVRCSGTVAVLLQA